MSSKTKEEEFKRNWTRELCRVNSKKRKMKEDCSKVGIGLSFQITFFVVHWEYVPSVILTVSTHTHSKIL